MGQVIVRPGGGSADSSELTASSANVLAGTTAITSDSDGEPKAGTMPNQGAWSKTDLAINGSVTIPAGYHNGTGKVSQSLATQGAVTYYATTTDQTLAAGRWLTGAVTIKAISATNLAAGNIANGVTISISNGNKAVFSATGTYKGLGNATAGNVLYGVTFSSAALSNATGTMPNNAAWSTTIGINGSATIPAGYHNGTGKVSQSVTTQGAVTYYATTSDQSLAAGRWLSGAVTIKAISATNLAAGNIANGVRVYVSNGTKNVWDVTGTYKGVGNAAVGDVLASKTFSTSTLSGATGTMVNRGAWGSTIGINGTVTIPAGYHNGTGKITQSIATQGALTYTPSTSVQTAAVSGKYMTGNITINAIPSTYYAPGSAVNFFNAGSYGPLATGGAKVHTISYRQSSGLKKTMLEYIIEDGYGSTATNSGGKLSCYYGVVDKPSNYVYNYEFSIVFRNKFPTSKYSQVVAVGDYTLSGYAASTTGRGSFNMNLFGVTDDNKIGDGYAVGDDFHYYSSMGSSTGDVSKITDPWFGIELNGWCSCSYAFSAHIDAYVTRIYGVVK